jgi:DNA-directed RNA polymerase subunit RPC12/RpoP
MFERTTLVEQSATKSSGYTTISYHCSNCGKIISFPEQQGFSYCYLCGAKVRKIKSVSLTWNPLK